MEILMSINSNTAIMVYTPKLAAMDFIKSVLSDSEQKHPLNHEQIGKLRDIWISQIQKRAFTRIISSGSIISLKEAPHVRAQKCLTGFTRDTVQGKGIVGYLPRVSELFATRQPKDSDEIDKIYDPQHLKFHVRREIKHFGSSPHSCPSKHFDYRYHMDEKVLSKSEVVFLCDQFRSPPLSSNTEIMLYYPLKTDIMAYVPRPSAIEFIESVLSDRIWNGRLNVDLPGDSIQRLLPQITILALLHGIMNVPPELEVWNNHDDNWGDFPIVGHNGYWNRWWV